MREDKIVEFAMVETLNYFDMSAEELRSVNRDPEIVAARTIVISEIRERTSLTLKQIANTVGLGNHATIHHAVEKAKYWGQSSHKEDVRRERQRIEISSKIERRINEKPIIPEGHENLYSSLQQLFGVSALETEIEEIIRAVKEDTV